MACTLATSQPCRPAHGAGVAGPVPLAGAVGEADAQCSGHAVGEEAPGDVDAIALDRAVLVAHRVALIGGERAVGADGATRRRIGGVELEAAARGDRVGVDVDAAVL